MEFRMDYKITLGQYQLMLLDSVEIHKSVDLLADTCVIKIPNSAYNKPIMHLEANGDYKIKRGDAVKVQLGYNGNLQDEFFGYILNINTDGADITINCEDSLFLLRKKVKDKQFVKVDVKVIVQYLLDQTGVKMSIDSTIGTTYDKFVISRATAYDVLKKIQEDTYANIFIQEGDVPVLNIHPLYYDKGGDVNYSFQINIEDNDLQYIRKEDRKIEVIVKTTGKDGKIKEVSYGTTGGDRITEMKNGMSLSSMLETAKNKYDSLIYDGYDGSITGWLVPYTEPTMSAKIVDAEYKEKDGTYYVGSVTTTFNSGGGKRKVQLGKKLSAKNG